MLTTIAAMFLTSYGLAYGYINFPLFEKLRNLVAKYISPKLNECYICATFWINLLLVMPATLLLPTYLSLFLIYIPFGVAGLAVIITYLISNQK